jgi:hypothetical protein
MKKFTYSCFMAAALASSIPTTAQPLTMTAGDTYVFHFDTLQFMGSGVTSPLGGQYNLLFNSATTDSGDSLRMELFEGLAEGTALAERTITPGSDVPFLLSESAWSDKEGSIRLTALSGTFTINQIDMIRKEISSNPGGMDTFALTIVPEPSTVTLGILGAALLAGGRLRRMKRRE